MERNRVDPVRRIEGQSMEQDGREADHGDGDDCQAAARMGGHSIIGRPMRMPVEGAEANRDGHESQRDQEGSP